MLVTRLTTTSMRRGKTDRDLFSEYLPADGINAAVNWRGHGRSRWQLSDKTTTIAGVHVRERPLISQRERPVLAHRVAVPSSTKRASLSICCAICAFLLGMRSFVPGSGAGAHVSIAALQSAYAPRGCRPNSVARAQDADASRVVRGAPITPNIPPRGVTAKGTRHHQI
jgi:hypothetical protein